MAKDIDRPAIHTHLALVAPFTFGFTIYGSATKRRFESALPKALARLVDDCKGARSLATEQGEDLGTPSVAKVHVNGDDEIGYFGHIDLPPTLTDEDLADLMPEIEAHARALFDEAMRLTRHAIANREACHV